MNNLVYFLGLFWLGFIFVVFSGWAYNCDSFLGYWGITFFGIILAGSMIVIVSWSYPLVGL